MVKIDEKLRMVTQNGVSRQNPGQRRLKKVQFRQEKVRFCSILYCLLFLKIGFVLSDSRTNSFGAGRRFVYTGSDFLRSGSFWGFCFPRQFSKSTEGFSNIEVSEKMGGSARIPRKWCQQARPGASLPHAPGVRMT